MTSAHVDTFCSDNLPPVDQWPAFVFDRPELQYPERLNCADVLLQHPSERRCLLSPQGERWTYGETTALVNQIAHVLVDDLGVVPGNRVLLRGPNNPWYAACWLAVIPSLSPRWVMTLHTYTLGAGLAMIASAMPGTSRLGMIDV